MKPRLKGARPKATMEPGHVDDFKHRGAESQTHFTLSVAPDSLSGAKQDMRPGDAEFMQGSSMAARTKSPLSHQGTAKCRVATVASSS